MAKTHGASPKNFQYPDLHWFRKIERHPDDAIEELAEDFARYNAGSIGCSIAPISWFEPAVAGEAETEWKASPCWGKSSLMDPLEQDLCRIFRWTGPRSRVFQGYTHLDSPKGIMLNAGCTATRLLEAVAEEYRHLYQDRIHAAESAWRRENEPSAEADAKEYVRLKADEIASFLERRGVS
jgi:hypothetical protein